MAHKYSAMEEMLTDVLGDLSILAGDTIGHSGVSWQDVAGTASVNLRLLADKIDKYRGGLNFGTDFFPSPAELIDND